jgi:hypothetical protein
MRPKAEYFSPDDRFSIRLIHRDGQYALTVECADNLTHEEASNFNEYVEITLRALSFHRDNSPSQEPAATALEGACRMTGID